MSWLLGCLAAGLAGLVGYLVYKVVTGGEKRIADRDARQASDRRADTAVAERDSLTVQLAAERVKSADLMLAKANVESERNALAREVSALKVKLVAMMPVGDEGAAVVNTEFSEPLLPLGDGLEKP